MNTFPGWPEPSTVVADDYIFVPSAGCAHPWVDLSFVRSTAEGNFLVANFWLLPLAYVNANREALEQTKAPLPNKSDLKIASPHNSDP